MKKASSLCICIGYKHCINCFMLNKLFVFVFVFEKSFITSGPGVRFVMLNSIVSVSRISILNF